MRLFTALTLLTLLSVVTPSQGDAQDRWGLPDSPTGQTLSAILDALDSGDDGTIRSFVNTYFDPVFRNDFSMDQHIGAFQGVREALGAFDVVRVEKTGPQSAEATLASMESDTRMTVDFEVNDAGQITSMGFVPIEDSPSSQIASFDQLNEHLNAEARAGRFSGTVLVARDAEVAFLDAYGYADQAKRSENRIDTRFNIGSLNKLFTGIAILQLAEAGRLDLDAPIGSYLDGFPEDVAAEVTVRHLLQHRSGWGAYWEHPYYLAHRMQLRTLSEYMSFLRDVPLDFDPGTRQQYSNTGYEVLGAIIESVAKTDYYAYIRQHIYEPAGMTGSGSYAIDESTPNLATGYMSTADGFTQPNTDTRPAKGTAAGGGYSTAGDLFRFDQALRAHKLISKTYTDLFQNRFEAGRAAPAGRGWAAYGGGGPGINAVFSRQPGDGGLIVVLSNFDPPTASDMAELIEPLATAR